MAEEKKKDELSEDQIIDLIADFYQDPDFEELKRLYLTKSFPEILAVDRREEIHSAFLAWLLDMKESHGLGDFPIKQLLKILVRRDRKQRLTRHGVNGSFKNINGNVVKTSTGDIDVEIINEDFTITEMSVKREVPVNGGRIDILIDMEAIFSKKGKKNIYIVIENKVYSDEHNEQTQTYFYHFKKTPDNKDIILFVYLTPLSKSDLDNLIQPECKCKEYIQTNYQDLLDYILEPAVKKDISMRNRFVIEEYIHSLSLPAINIDNDEYNINLNTILAMTNKTTDLLKSFWEKNEPLLKAALSSLVETTYDVDIKKELNDALNALEQRKDNTKYKFGVMEANGKMDLVRKVVIAILEKGIDPKELSETYKKALEGLKENGKFVKDKTFEKLNEKDEFKNKMTCQSKDKFCNPNNNDLVLSEAEYDDWLIKNEGKKVIYSEVEVTVNGKKKKCYVLNQWGYGNIDYFVYAYYKVFKQMLDNKEIEVIKPNE